MPLIDGMMSRNGFETRRKVDSMRKEGGDGKGKSRRKEERERKGNSDEERNGNFLCQ